MPERCPGACHGMPERCPGACQVSLGGVHEAVRGASRRSLRLFGVPRGVSGRSDGGLSWRSLGGRTEVFPGGVRRVLGVSGGVFPGVSGGLRGVGRCLSWVSGRSSGCRKRRHVGSSVVGSSSTLRDPRSRRALCPSSVLTSIRSFPRF